MKEIKIEKETVSTSIIDLLNDTKSVKNMAGKTYHYVATISDYQNSKNYNRNYNNVGDLSQSNGLNYMVSTDYLDKLNENELLEIKINIRESGKYSSVSQTFLAVLENNKDYIRFATFDTAYQAFKFNADVEARLNEAQKIISEKTLG